MSEPLEKTATWVRPTPGGGVEVEHYDFSLTAEEHFGGDVAFFVVVSAQDIALLRELLGAPSGTLPDAIAHQFGGYHAFKEWLLEHGVPFEARFDSWA